MTQLRHQVDRIGNDAAYRNEQRGHGIDSGLLFEIVGDRHGVFDVACPQCGHGCKSPFNQRRPVLRIWRRTDAFLSFNCARCGWQGSTGRGSRTVASIGLKSAIPLAKQTKSGAEPGAFAIHLWRRASPLPGTIVEVYLANRGIALTDTIHAADALRFDARCPFGAERHPAMVALMRDVLTNEPKAIHRTALKANGSGKAALLEGQSPKQMLGPAAGCAVKLIDDAEVTIGLGVAEGIENALTALCAGWSPVWAAGCKGALAKFPILAGIDALTVFSDPEPGGVEAARACARRWQNAGHEGTVVIPPGSDWNDIGRTT